MNKTLKSVLAGGASMLAVNTAFAANFNVPEGDLRAALNAYATQALIPLIVSDEEIKNAQSRGVHGEFTADVALARILAGTGFSPHRTASGAILVVRDREKDSRETARQQLTQLAQSQPERAASNVETVVVTSSKIKGDIQTVPIAITALSQEELTARQIAGGPDLVKEVPNLTFSKTNFTGYNLEIRGIGTQAISVTIDPAVAVAFNDTPFLRNHFFEQEFFDVSQVEVLRGPQGTLYGRNANAGVVNLVSAKPTDQFEAMLSADWGNYSNRRYEGMINLPLADDKLMLRVAGEWTKRDGYAFNEITGQQTDGRDLWSTRATLRWKPVESVTADLIWEHFQENDDRLRSGKQLCKTDLGPNVNTPGGAGSLVDYDGNTATVFPAKGTAFGLTTANFSQGCLPASLYAKDSFGVPNGFSMPFIAGAGYFGYINTDVDPYTSTVQSTNLRHIQSTIEPRYLAKNDTYEFNASWNITPALSLNSETGYNTDFLWSTEDFNRFNTSRGIFNYKSTNPAMTPDPDYPGSAIVCDPQLGCADRLVVQDLSTERSWQFSQEIRLSSDFEGPFNFSAGGNYLHYVTDEKYYVFSNSFTLIALNNICLDNNGHFTDSSITDTLKCMENGRQYATKNVKFGGGVPTESPQYVDPNPITSLDDAGHNYFLSNNPYSLNSYALFGEVYYNITKDLKFTGGLRWTDDEKEFIEYPSQVLTLGYGYASNGIINQSWKKYTGRAVLNWTPKLDFTDQSMFYASYAHGYKAGGANPPGSVLLQYSNEIAFPTHPLTFEPEYINAYELGTKNTAFDGDVTFNGDVFYYDYKGYQISQIVDRTSVNINVDATVRGAEIQTTWAPLQGVKLGFTGGYEDTRINNNQYAIDLIDRTAGHPGWVVMKPWVGQASNCIFPEYVAAALVELQGDSTAQGSIAPQACAFAYNANLDPVTGDPYSSATTGFDAYSPSYHHYDYPGFDPSTAPNNGEGFAKPLGGNELPNAPHFTASLTADYTMPVSADWAATLHGDFYWQSQSWARIFNDRPYDKIRGYSNVNLALILTDATGWQAMAYVKNIFDTTAVTGDFLNSDDTGLTTNVFLTDPRLFGLRLTKQFSADAGSGGFDLFSNASGKPAPIWLEFGGDFAMLSARQTTYVPPFESKFEGDLPTPVGIQKTPDMGLDWNAALSYRPDDSDWVVKAGIRYGRKTRHNDTHKSITQTQSFIYLSPSFRYECPPGTGLCSQAYINKFVDAKNAESERHLMLDFTLGRDVGIGESAKSTISAGVRMAQFSSRNVGRFNADPNYYFGPHAYIDGKYHQVFNADVRERHSFHGIGPQLTWDGSAPIFGTPQNGQITFDWGANAALLFGRQRTSIFHQTWHCTLYGPAVFFKGCGPTYSAPENIHRSKNVTVPNLGGYAGLSVQYEDAKISFGYRADEFFGAMDGGEATAKKYDRGFYGPYLNISVGLGG